MLAPKFALRRCMELHMPCDARFGGPIKLLSRGLVHTLRQAAEHIMTLPITHPCMMA